MTTPTDQKSPFDAERRPRPMAPPPLIPDVSPWPTIGRWAGGLLGVIVLAIAGWWAASLFEGDDADVAITDVTVLPQTITTTPPAPPTTAEDLVAVPQLAGVDVDTAAEAIEALGLEAQQDNDPSLVIPAGTVIRTIPLPGTELEPGERVILVVSSGAIATPDVVGLDADAAATVLLDSGLTFTTVFNAVAVDDPALAGKVSSQSPVPGTPLAPLDEVEIRITYLVVHTVRVSRSGATSVPLSQTLDLDTGVVGAGADADLWYQADTNAALFLNPLNGSQIAVLGTNAVDPLSCPGATLVATAIPMAQLAAGTNLCVLTNIGRWSVVSIQSPVPTGSADLSVAFTTYVTGVVSIDENFSFDFDDGVVATSAGADIVYSVVDSSRSIAPRNGASIGVVSTANRRSECVSATLSSTSAIAVSQLGQGTTVCVRTSAGRYATFEMLAAVGASPSPVSIQYLTWQS